MSVGVVTRQRAMVNPEDALGTEVAFQTFLYLFLRHGLVTMGCHQTASGGEHRPTSVALNASAFEHEVEAVHIFAIYVSSVIKLTIQGVIEVGRELFAPAIKAEIEQAVVSLVVGEGDEAVVAGPSVVGGYRLEVRSER